LARAWPRIAVTIGSAWIAILWLDRPVLGIDTLRLFRGTEALERCLREADLVDCHPPGSIDPFPVFQHVPDLAAYSLLGLSDGGRVRVLALLSALAIAASLAAAWAVLRHAGCPARRAVVDCRVAHARGRSGCRVGALVLFRRELLAPGTSAAAPDPGML
jgi:hypothetical protein